MGKQRIVLENGINIPLPRWQIAGGFTKDSDRPAGKLFKSGNQAQAGGFAGAGRPQH